MIKNKTSTKWFPIAITLLWLCTACNNQQSNSAGVSDLNKQFINAWNAKDTSKINPFLADDVQFVQADGHFSGKAQVIDKWIKESLPAIGNLKTNVISSDADARIGYEAGTFSVDVTAPNQPSAIGEGNYIFLWKKLADNNWKISYIQIEDLPLQVANRK